MSRDPWGAYGREMPCIELFKATTTRQSAGVGGVGGVCSVHLLAHYSLNTHQRLKTASRSSARSVEQGEQRGEPHGPHIPHDCGAALNEENPGPDLH